MHGSAQAWGLLYTIVLVLTMLVRIDDFLYVCVHDVQDCEVYLFINNVGFSVSHQEPKNIPPQKSAPSGSKGAQLRQHIDATLAVDFFNQVNLLYGTLTEFCTPENCPTMSADPKYAYKWADRVVVKKPIEVSAPKCVEYLMDWIESLLDDESLFPQKLGALLLEEIITVCGMDGVDAVIDSIKGRISEPQHQKDNGVSGWWRVCCSHVF